jgi:uncharacterized protein
MPRQNNSRDGMLRPGVAVLLWGALCLAAAFAEKFYGNPAGQSTRVFGSNLALLAILLAGELWLAAPALRDGLTRAAGPQGGVLVALYPLAAYTTYAFAAGTFSWRSMGIASAFALLPLVILASAHGARPGAWQDYVAMLAIYALFALLRPLFPYRTLLGSMLGMLFAVNVAAATFLFVRRLEGIGYSMGWPLTWVGGIALAYVAVAAIDIPLGAAIHFIQYAPGSAPWRMLPFNLLRLFFLTAWPEEFLFRGLLQNLLGKSLRSENAAWLLTSVIFGLSHIFHQFPNWRYVLLATVAGCFYGLLWRKTKSLFPGAVLHTLVDATWQTLFRTL